MIAHGFLDGLAPTMQRLALACKDRFPFVDFVSGRRTVEQQARAMAINVMNDRNFIRQTYLHAAVLQTIVDTHPDWRTVQDFEDGFTVALNGMSDADRAKVSDHFAGLAVDLYPLEEYHDTATGDKWAPTEHGWLVINWIRQQPETKYFTTREGGNLRRWHWAVREPVTQEA